MKFNLILKLLTNNIFLCYIIFTLSFKIYVNSIENELFYDDTFYVINNSFIKDIKNIPKIFTKDFFNLAKERTYRPVHTLSYFMDYKLWGLNKSGWHLTVVFFHSLNGILIFFLILLLMEQNSNKKMIGFLTAMFFVTHPVHSEVLNCMTFGRYTMCFTFILLSIISYIKYKKNNFILYYFISIISYLSAICIREIATPLPLILMVYDYFISGKKVYGIKENIKYFIFNYLIYFLFFLLLIFLNKVGFKPIVVVEGIESYRPQYLNDSFYITMLTQSKITIYYLKMLIFPVKQIFLYSGEILVSIPESIFDMKVILSFLGLIAIIIFGFLNYKKYPVMFFSIMFFYIFLLPISNLIPFWAKMADRYLYVSSLGFFMILALLLGKIKNSYITLFFGLIIILFYSNRTIIRNQDWKDPLTFYLKKIKDSPSAAFAHNDIACMYVARKEYDKAIVEYKKSIELNPNDHMPHFSYGNVLNQYSKDFEKALSEFEIVLELRPSYKEVYTSIRLLNSNIENSKKLFKNKKITNIIENLKLLKKIKEQSELNPEDIKIRENLAVLYAKLYEYDKTILEYEKIIELKPDYYDAYEKIGTFYSAFEYFDKAILIYEKMIKMNPDDYIVYNNLGVLNTTLKKNKIALKYFNKSIQINPEYAGAYNNLGKYYYITKKYKKAYNEYMKALKLDPKLSRAYNNLGLMYKSLYDNTKAIEMYKKAVELEPDNIKYQNDYKLLQKLLEKQKSKT